MALDKQMILSELGSVMNKLQSADCGCMGKLFSNQGQNSNQGGATMGSQLPTCGGCRRGCCHGHGYGDNSHGYGAPCAGEPYSMNSPCMGMQCNPPKLYADTYNYLSSNLMQPIVKEVYQDLKSINPANSVVNNPMASQMGLQQQGGAPDMSGNPGMTQNQMPGNEMSGMQNPNMAMDQQYTGQQMTYNQQMPNQPMSQMGGMGPNIVNMMNGDGQSSGKTGQFAAPMVTGASQGQAPDPGMSHGQYSAEYNNNQASYGGQQQVQGQFMQQQNMSNPMNPNPQNTMNGNMQQSSVNQGASYKVNYSNPAAQQMSSNRGKPNYGQHTPGVAKFNEMFPGVMGGMGGDLGFDPMSIAIQMNPANQQQAAMGQMQKLMNGSPMERVLDPSLNARTMQPAVAGANMAANAVNQQPIGQQNISPSNQQTIPVQPGTQQSLQGYTNMAVNQPNQAQHQVYGQVPQQQQQQVYTAQSGAPVNNQSQPPQHYQQELSQQYQQQNVDPNMQQYQQQQNMDPNAQAPYYPNYEETNADAYINQQSPQSYDAPPTTAPDQQMIKEPIFPVDTSKNQPPHMKHQRHYEYNTLGQPVEMLPARLYHQPPETNMQQTLSPQPISKMRTDQSRFTVKNTVSKTSLMGSRPVGRTPSRGQLQHIYNQYKGSHSYTQQNIRPPVQGATFSEGKINVALANANQRRHVPVERVGGDTLANNQMVHNQVPVKGQPMGHNGDVPMPVDNKPHGDIIPSKELPTKRTRNGLQDMVYTSYPTSAAWSFHGNNDRSPYAPGYRLRRT